MKKQDQITSTPKSGFKKPNSGLFNIETAKSFWYVNNKKTVMPVTAKEVIILLCFIAVSKILGGLTSIFITLFSIGWLSVVMTNRGYEKLLEKIAYIVAIIGVAYYTFLLG